MQMNFVPDIFSEKLYLMENVPFLYLNNKFSEKKQNFFLLKILSAFWPFAKGLKKLQRRLEASFQKCSALKLLQKI